MTEAMRDGIVLSLYGMGLVFAALVSFALLVTLIRKVLPGPTAVSTADEESPAG